MKILHVASFHGNVGDNAHHHGMRQAFESLMGPQQWIPHEIRHYYRSWHDKSFDEDFANLANMHDAVVIGGGNFFEICHDYSETGCTINISPRILDKISVPLFFNALGFDIRQGHTDQNARRFRSFLDSLLRRPRTVVSFRNDGSAHNFTQVYGEFDDRIQIIPDGGFFLADLGIHPMPRCVGINLAADMPHIRFEHLPYERFIENIQMVIEILAREEHCHFRLFPHISKDYKPILDLLDVLDDRVTKFNLEVMPYRTGQGSEIDFFRSYAECELVAGMRFHSVVCAYGLGRTVVPLDSYPRIHHVFREIDEPGVPLNIAIPTFVESFLARARTAFQMQPDHSSTLAKLRSDQRKVLKLVQHAFVGCDTESRLAK